jgi:hypothetical protein
VQKRKDKTTIPQHTLTIRPSEFRLLEQNKNPFFDKSKTKDLRKWKATNKKEQNLKNGEKGRSRERGREGRGGDGVVFLCCKERNYTHQEYIYIILYTQKILPKTEVASDGLYRPFV